MKLALLVVATSSAALADPPAPPPAWHQRCTPGPFADVMLGATNDGIFHRVSGGYAFRTCDYALAIGANGVAGSAKQDSGTGGFGFNVEPMLRTTATTRVGLFVSYDFNDHGRRLYTAEARLHVSDAFWVEGGVAHLTIDPYGGIAHPENLVVAGVGLEGKAGFYIGGVEVLLAGIAFAFLAGAGGISGGG